MTTMLSVFNVITKETAAWMSPSERALADKLVATLRRNGALAGEHGAAAWTVIEVHDDDDQPPHNSFQP